MSPKSIVPSLVCLTAIGFAGCGGSTPTRTVTVRPAAESAAPSPTSTQHSGTSSGTSKRAHKVRSSRAPHRAPVHTQCDANIRVRTATTTCPFAENVFVAFWTNQTYDGVRLSAYSPAAGHEFDLECTPGEGAVVCTAGDGGEVTFSQTAVDAYTLSQAKRYVASHDVGARAFPWTGSHPTSNAPPSSPPSTQAPAPSAPDTSSTPAGGNIPNYENGNGYRVQCTDGTYSHSGGIQGACSHHGGVG